MHSSKHRDSQFEVHTLPDWQPKELLQNWRDVLMSSHTSDQTRRDRRNKLSVMPYRSELQWYRRLEINVWTRVLVVSIDNDLTTGRNCRSRKKPGTANGADLYVVCPSDELVRDGFQQAAAISCRFNNPISRKSWKTRLSLARVTFKPFRSTFTIGK